MKYMGSKNRFAKELLPIILKDRINGQHYIEPFAGGMNLIDKVDGKRIANEIKEYLIDNGDTKIYPDNLIAFTDFVEKDRAKQLFLYNVGVSFIKELIQKETDVRTKLSENLDFYKGRESMQMYERTFDLWNKQNLVLWDLKDILCRMGVDVD